MIIYVDGGDELGNITFVLIIIYRSIYILGREFIVNRTKYYY